MATQYADIADLEAFGIASAAWGPLPESRKTAALQRASEEADCYIQNVLKLPLSSWGRDLRTRVVDMAVYHLLSQRGFSPADPAGNIVVRRYEDAIKWLERVAGGRSVMLATGAVDQTPAVYEGGAYVVTRPRRGW